jgi:hypothetical protein
VVPFSYFVLPNSFSPVMRASGPVFMFCPLGLIFGDTEGVGSLFHVLRAQTYFRRYRVCRVPFSCFMLPDSFSAVPRASGPVFKFCALGLIFDGIKGVARVGSRFHVLRARNHFQRFRGRRVPFFMFCAPRLVLGGAECVGSCFHILPAQTRFRRCRGRRVPFSCFARPDSFSAVPSASGPGFMFCPPGLILGGAECVGSRLHILPAWTCFRRSRGRRVPFFACPDSFSSVPRASGPAFMLCARKIMFITLIIYRIW